MPTSVFEENDALLGVTKPPQAPEKADVFNDNISQLEGLLNSIKPPPPQPPSLGSQIVSGLKGGVAAVAEPLALASEYWEKGGLLSKGASAAAEESGAVKALRQVQEDMPDTIAARVASYVPQVAAFVGEMLVPGGALAKGIAAPEKVYSLLSKAPAFARLAQTSPRLALTIAKYPAEFVKFHTATTMQGAPQNVPGSAAMSATNLAINALPGGRVVQGAAQAAAGAATSKLTGGATGDAVMDAAINGVLGLIMPSGYITKDQARVQINKMRLRHPGYAKEFTALTRLLDKVADKKVDAENARLDVETLTALRDDLSRVENREQIIATINERSRLLDTLGKVADKKADVETTRGLEETAARRATAEEVFAPRVVEEVPRAEGTGEAVEAGRPEEGPVGGEAEPIRVRGTAEAGMEAPAGEKGEARARLNKILGSEAGAFRPGAILETGEKAAETVSNVGQAGRHLYKFAEKYPSVRMFANKIDRIEADTNNLTGAMTDSPLLASRKAGFGARQWAREGNLVRALRGEVKPETEKQQQLVDAYKKSFADAADYLEVVDAKFDDGTPFKRRQVYAPAVFTEEAMEQLLNGRGPVFDFLHKRLGAKEFELLISGARMKFGERDFSFLHHRNFDIPSEAVIDGKKVQILDVDPKILNKYFHNAARKIALTENLYKDPITGEVEVPPPGESDIPKYLRELSERAVAEGMRRKVADVIFPTYWKMAQGIRPDSNIGTLSLSKDTWAGKRLSEARNLATTAQMSGILFQNMTTGMLPHAMYLGAKNSAKGLAKALTTRLTGDKAKDIRILGNLADDMVAGLEWSRDMYGGSTKLTRGMFKATGGRGVNVKLNMAAAYAMVESSLPELADALKNKDSGTLKKLWGMDAGSARRALREFGFSETDIDRFVLKGKEGITNSDRALAVNKIVDLVNVFHEMPSSKPRVVMGPVWELIGRYTSYQRKMMRAVDYTVKEARHGNVRPMVMAIVGGQAAGELYNAVWNLVMDRKNEKEGWDRFLSNYANAAMFGLYGQFEYALRKSLQGRGEKSLPEALMGSLKSYQLVKELMPPEVDFWWNEVASVLQAVDPGLTDKNFTPMFRTLQKNFSAGRIAESVIRRGSPEFLAERLSKMVYTSKGRHKDGSRYYPLDPKPRQERTAKMLLERMKAMGLSTAAIERLVEEADARLKGKTEEK